MNPDFLNRTFLGNTVENYLWLTGIIIAGLIFKRLFSKLFSLILFRIFKKYSTDVTAQEFHDLLKKPFAVFFLLIIGYIAFNHISFPAEWRIGPEEKFGVRMIIHKLYQVVVIFSVTWILLRIIDFFALILINRAARTHSRVDDQLIPFFKDGIKIFIVILCFFFILGTVFSVNIVTLIGGLGIGGLAVALAAKETLENLFGSFTIFLDKPFIVGDLVKVGVVSGHVEKIGLRSTRIRTLDKSIVIVPNKKMVDAETENITERTLWRARQEIRILYSTSKSDIEKIISGIRKILDGHEKITDGSNVNFDSFGISAIEILVIYFVRTTDGDEFSSVKEEINFKIMEVVRSNNSDFAYPTSRVFVENRLDDTLQQTTSPQGI